MGGVLSKLGNPSGAATAPAGEVVEGVVAKFSDLKDGELKECALGDGKVLVVRDKNKVFATGTKCTHYGASLKTGAYCDGRIRCPWHGAAFNAKTGDIEDFPGLDSLASYETKVVNDEVIVRAPKDLLKADRVVTKSKVVDLDKQLFLIIGGGAAGVACAETLRKLGFGGSILVVSKEGFLPYDRPKLSKSMTIEASKIQLRTEEFYRSMRIEFMLNTTVDSLDPDTKTAVLSSGSAINYDAALVCTGGTPRTLPTAGFKSKNVYLLRDVGEAHVIAKESVGKNVVIVGTSFIGMETAASIVRDAKSVTCIGMERVAFERVLGLEVGAAIQKWHESQKVQLRMEEAVDRFEVTDGLVTGVVLKGTGQELPADIVVVGAGVVPATGFIKADSKAIKLHPHEKSILTDEYMHAGGDLYAAGDIARFPLAMLGGELARIEHWGMAHYQGQIAAYNMLGKKKPATAVPFFWTQQYGKSVRYAGHALKYNEVLIDKAADGFDSDKLKFAAFYANENKILAVATMQRDPLAAQVAELLHHNRMPSATDVKKAIAAGTLDKLIASSLV